MKRAAVAGIAFFVAGGQFLSWSTLITPEGSVRNFLGWHLLCFLSLLAGWNLTFGKEESPRRITMLLMAGLCPGAGPLAAAILLLSLGMKPLDPAGFQFRPEELRLPALPLALQLKRAGWSPGTLGEDLRPAADLLRRGSNVERLAAVEVLSELGEPAQIAELQRALNDPEREIYQMAHAKLTRLQEAHAERLARGRELGPERHLEALIAYLESGLLGASTGEFHVQTALGLVEELNRARPRADLYDLRGRLLARQGDHHGALGSFEAALRLAPGHLESLWGAAQAAYQIGAFVKVDEYLTELSRFAEDDSKASKFFATLSWWEQSGA